MLSKDAWMVISGVGLLILLFAWLGLVYWALFLTAFGLLLGAFEYYLWRTRRETLSSQFWAFKTRHRRWGLFLLLVLAAFFLFLLLHLGVPTK